MVGSCDHQPMRLLTIRYVEDGDDDKEPENVSHNLLDDSDEGSWKNKRRGRGGGRRGRGRKGRSEVQRDEVVIGLGEHKVRVSEKTGLSQ